jgi:hypothetical protein
MCEQGVFENGRRRATKMGWLVYEDSFLKWVKSLETPEDPA